MRTNPQNDRFLGFLGEGQGRMALLIDFFGWDHVKDLMGVLQYCGINEFQILSDWVVCNGVFYLVFLGFELTVDGKFISMTFKILWTFFKHEGFFMNVSLFSKIAFLTFCLRSNYENAEKCWHSIVELSTKNCSWFSGNH